MLVLKLPDGSRQRISGTAARHCNTKVAAHQAMLDHIEHLRRSGAVEPKRKELSPRFSEFADQFLAIAKTKNKLSEVQRKEMIVRCHLAPTFENRRLEQIGYAEIQDYVTQKVKTHAPKTVNNHLTVLRRLLVVAKKRGLIEAVPEIEWLKAAQPDFDFFDFDEADRLVGAADGEWKVMIVIALKTGMRQGELIGHFEVRKGARDSTQRPGDQRPQGSPSFARGMGLLRPRRRAALQRRVQTSALARVPGCRLAPDRMARAAALVRQPPGDGGRAPKGGSGATGARHDRDDDALCAPLA